jgi:hypothetical protein
VVRPAGGGGLGRPTGAVHDHATATAAPSHARSLMTDRPMLCVHWLTRRARPSACPTWFSSQSCCCCLCLHGKLSRCRVELDGTSPRAASPHVTAATGTGLTGIGRLCLVCPSSAARPQLAPELCDTRPNIDQAGHLAAGNGQDGIVYERGIPIIKRNIVSKQSLSM